MNYEEMSDAQIAEAVVKTIELDLGEYWMPSATGHGVVIINDDDDTVRTFDPCNNPADMWPLIVENGIVVAPYRSATPEAWSTAFGLAAKFHAESQNPLRAGAIVYLMMKEAGK
ncbi:phage protein NinX family protein [Edwardsiella piscicida]|uniref:phage protein NinX family protein n=1 Tax=Edwardsiella piscicida TaxID=1263550 RepID=UPI000D510B1C|nr:phage protein NinX family protein [Edwardsiella piscicida]UCQ43018.1 DUF2591 domain-containing protein [Edwardsiella piscicida]